MLDTPESVHGITKHDFCYLIPLEKFIIRQNGEWNFAEPLGKEGLKHHLLASGIDQYTIQFALKNYTYDKVYGYELAPGKESMYEDAGGRLMINLWVPPTLKPAPAPYPRVQKLLDWVACGDKDGVTWLTHWLAAKVQNPVFVPKVAVVITTEQGGGKGTLAFILRQMLGEGNCATIKRDELENRFNGRWIGKLFVLADEVLSNDNLRDISDRLKVLIDGSEIEMERKGKDQRAVRNRLAWIFASNDPIAPVVVEASDRRYSVFSNHSQIPVEYEKLLKSCFMPDRVHATPDFLKEIAGFYHSLLDVEVDMGLITKPFGNDSRELLIEANLPSHKLFAKYVGENGIEDLLDDVLAHGSYGLTKNKAQWDFGDQGLSVEVVYRCYVEFCKRFGAKPLKLNRFGIALRRHHPPWERLRNTTAEGRRVYCYVVPRSVQ